MIKTLNKLGIEGNFFTLMRDIDEKPRTGVVLNGEGLSAFSPGSATIQGCLLLPLLFSIVLEILVRTIDNKKL